MFDATPYKRQSGAIGALAMVLIAIIGLIVLAGLVFAAVYIPGYNRVIALDQAAAQAWGDVDAQLQRRFDLVGNLVETVKGYASQEKEIFETVALARTKYFQADTGNVQGRSAPQRPGASSRACSSSGATRSSNRIRTSWPCRTSSKARRTASPSPARATTRPRPGSTPT
jgi:hypothetical protein